MCRVVDFLSEKRLSKYGDPNKPQTVEEYFFNVELCESLYPLLSQFEVALRNKIDAVFSKYMGENWIFDFVRQDEKLTEEKNITDRNEIDRHLDFCVLESFVYGGTQGTNLESLSKCFIGYIFETS